MVENQHCYQVIDSLTPLLQINTLLNQEIEWMDKAIASMMPFLEISQIWANDAIAHEQVLDNICYQFSDPEFLVFWAFTTWNKLIKADGQGALEWIRDELIALTNTYEQRYIDAYGGHSPLWQQQAPMMNPVMGSPDSQAGYAPQNLPMFPVPGSAGVGGGPLDQLKQRIAQQKSGNPNLGSDLQRAHVMSRQQMMPQGGY